MINKEEIIEIGKFQKTHALKGELNALLNIDTGYIDEGNPIIVETEGLFIPFYVSSFRKKGTTSFLLKIDGIDEENDAKKFVNASIYALKENLKAFYKEEGYDLEDGNDLIGFTVIDKASRNSIGEINDIDDSTSNVLFHVLDSNKDKIYIPVVEDWIYEIDDEHKKIIMEFPEGLINLNLKPQNT